jgi:hypothetical protein
MKTRKRPLARYVALFVAPAEVPLLSNRTRLGQAA